MMYDEDLLKPKSVHFSPVSDRDLDAFRRLPKAALVRHVDDAIAVSGAPRYVAASDVEIEYMEPVIGAQTLRIDVWIEHCDSRSSSYGFLVSSENGCLAYARGERTLFAQNALAYA